MDHKVVLLAVSQPTVMAHEGLQAPVYHIVVLVQVALHTKMLVATRIRTNVRSFVGMTSHMDEKFALAVNGVGALAQRGVILTLEKKRLLQLPFGG